MLMLVRENAFSQSPVQQQPHVLHAWGRATHADAAVVHASAPGKSTHSPALEPWSTTHSLFTEAAVNFCTLPAQHHSPGPVSSRHILLPELCWVPAGPWPSDSNQLPIVYHPHYNITLFGIEKLHPFDSCKFEKVVSGLQQHGIISSTKQLVQPAAVSYTTLQQAHAQDYLHKLQTSSLKVAQVGWIAGCWWSFDI
jgi:histone deacetylase 11